MATMKRVAEAAGVSESTVSHVVNGTRLVSEERRQKVLSAMRELGFSANAHARGLARGRSNFLGLLISDVENPFFAGVIKAFEEVASREGFEILFFSTNYDTASAERACRKLAENQVAAVAVLTSQLEPEMLRFLSTQGVDTVMLDGTETGPRRSSLRIRYEVGAVESVQCLYNLGHRSLAMIAGPQNRRSHIAYRAAVESAAMALHCKLHVVEGNNTPEAGAAAVRELLRRKDLPTAVLCSNDVTAMGALQAFLQAGLRVPEDVSLIGADDLAIAQLSTPPLTTVHLPRRELGLSAFQAIQHMLHAEDHGGLEISVDTHLIVRGSTAAAKATVS